LSNLRTLEDLRSNEPPQLFATDQVAIKARLVKNFEERTGKTLFEAQPEMFMIETMAYALSVRAEAEQSAVLQNTIVWSEGRHIEDHAANVSIFRILPTPATTTLKFTIELSQATDITIEAGARVSGGGFVFALDADVIIPALSLEASGAATCLTTGQAANNLPAFSVNVAVDALPAGVTVYNVTISSGGSDVEDIERLRERAANGNFRISKAGPGNGYREVVKGLHADIVDVGTVKPEPGHIHIYPLMKDGIPSEDVKTLVFDGLDPEKVVPQGDYIFINSPTPVTFDFTLIIRIDAADTAIEDAGRATVTGIFESWSQVMGVRVSPSVITSETRNLPGVVDAEVAGLDYTDLTETEFAVLGNLIIDVQVTPNV